MLSMRLTFDTDQEERSELKLEAPANILARSVTEEVSQKDKLPLNE